MKKRYLLNEVKVGIMRMRVKDIYGVPPGTAANSTGQGMVAILPHNTDNVCDTHRYYNVVAVFLQFFFRV